LKPTLVSVLLAVLLLVAVLLLGIFLPQKTPRVVVNQYRAVRSIRGLSLAEHGYAVEHPDAGFTCDIDDLGQRGLVDRVLASGTKAGYHFELRCSQSGSKKATAYTIAAAPTRPGTTGLYALCTDQSGEIWYSENGSTSDCLANHRPIEQKYR
jgi:hypothetical protein